MTLFSSIMTSFNILTPLSSVVHEERSRGRYEKRKVRILEPDEDMKNIWKGLQTVIHAERCFIRKGKETRSDRYYISSIVSDDAALFYRGILCHWSIENRLHWIKDVVQHEDDSNIKKGNGIEVLSILKNISINISRELGFDSIKEATIHFASNIKELVEHLRT